MKPLREAPHISGRLPADHAEEPISQSVAPPVDTFRRKKTGKGRSAKLWKPKHVYFTAAAWEEEHGRRIAARLDELGVVYERLKGNRLPRLGGSTTRETYKKAKNTLAVVNAPPGQMKLTPIPPSADWQFHLAKGCPAHCQYCYLAGSLSGAPITRVYANLNTILGNVDNYIQPGEERATSFEASCYTDPLGLEHLTGSISHTIEKFGQLGPDPSTNSPGASLRWVTKYDDVTPLLNLDHQGRTRCRISLNADWVTKKLEGGTADLTARIEALRKLREAGYPVGVVLAPIMPFPGWEESYADVLDRVATAVGTDADITFELITHRFTPGSKQVLLDWYPNTKLDLEEEGRRKKFNKFGGHKFVYEKNQLGALKKWMYREVGNRFGEESILYFT
ncbi:SPL family radical SAM protein [Neolewinella antarctica]|uniref:Spore photoproduct lyase n=1 Tax=Neolewinella antarctica TaxID=442734 RepID=A0ABX0X929_9BACT|nr:radical SAM protein [Neolewinella antarctica]NJC25770.1 spore photoproduct lyase [Neolewinella antarctica]